MNKKVIVEIECYLTQDKDNFYLNFPRGFILASGFDVSIEVIEKEEK